MRSRAIAGALFVILACRSTPYREVDIDFTLADGGAASSVSASEPRRLRFSVAAMLSPRRTHTAYARLIERIGARLGVGIDLVQRRTYREINDLLAVGKVDVAFVCTGGYLDLVRRAPTAATLLAAPVVNGEATYRSYLIVPKTSATQGLKDLAGKRFAYTDELSLTGYAYPRHLMRSTNLKPDGFFSDTIMTRSHDRSINAVLGRLVEGAAVDGLIYDYLISNDPGLGEATRIIHRSPAFGIPPVVLSTRQQGIRQRLRDVLLSLHEDAEARPFMRALHFDRFVEPPKEHYDSARTVLAGGE